MMMVAVGCLSAASKWQLIYSFTDGSVMSGTNLSRSTRKQSHPDVSLSSWRQQQVHPSITPTSCRSINWWIFLLRFRSIHPSPQPHYLFFLKPSIALCISIPPTKQVIELHQASIFSITSIMKFSSPAVLLALSSALAGSSAFVPAARPRSFGIVSSKKTPAPTTTQRWMSTAEKQETFEWVILLMLLDAFKLSYPMN